MNDMHAGDEEEEAPTALRQPTVDWNTATAVLYIVQERVSWAVGRPVVFDDAMLATLRAAFDGNHMHFWTIVDQLHERLMLVPWDAVPPDAETERAAAVLAAVHPVPCEIPEVEFVQMFLGKLWLPDSDGELGGDAQPQAGEAEEDAAARERMIELAVANVYTWDAAEQVVRKVAARLNERVRGTATTLAFDDKHIACLRARYADDPLGFWSVLDQLQQRLMSTDWADVHAPSRFIQGILNASVVPTSAPLSAFMAAAIPAHSLVPYGQPPTVLRTEPLSTASAAAVSASRGSARAHGRNFSQADSSERWRRTSPLTHHLDEPHHGQPSGRAPGGGGGGGGGGAGAAPSTSPATTPRRSPMSPRAASPATAAGGAGGAGSSAGGARQAAGADVTMDTVDPEANYPYCWRAVLEAIAAIEARLHSKFGKRITFDDKHKQDLFARWLAEPKGFFSVLDQIQERLCQTNWETVRDDGRYIQSLIAKFDPQTVVSTFIQSFVTPPEVAAAAAAAALKVVKLIDLDWDTIAREVIPALEERVSDCVGRPVRFDEKHKQHFKQRFDRDQQAFWSVLDQVQERMSTSDWSNVRTPQRFIQSFITKAQPSTTFAPSLYLEHVLRTVHEHGDTRAVWPQLKRALAEEAAAQDTQEHQHQPRQQQSAPPTTTTAAAAATAAASAATGTAHKRKQRTQKTA